MSNFKIEFWPFSKESELLVACPKPAKSFYPTWLKEMPNRWTNNLGQEFPTGTQCMPFTDSFSTGYIQELPCDVEFTKSVNEETGSINLGYRWAGDLQVMDTRQEHGAPLLLPKFPGFYHADLQWLTFWEPKTPPGYSALYVHPLNRFDLPFQTMSGIIDTDNWPVHGPIPFLLKEDFVGVIPAGTPMYQIIFVKRDEWVSKKGTYNEEKSKPIRYKVFRHFSGGYKKNFWIKKSYN